MSAPVIVGRLFPGLRYGDRLAHLFHDPGSYPGNVNTLCGRRFYSGDVEWLNAMAPSQQCEDCVAEAAP